VNIYDLIMWAYWVLLLFFVGLIVWDLYRTEDLWKKILAGAILVPFIVRLLWLA
jgi:uncharacterized protein YqhQ